jgi:hypothetical protein
MKFTPQQIELAVEMKKMGLPWEPAVGDYVYDEAGHMKTTSPFQDRVYFLLNYDCFMDRVGGVERFKAIMTWLPTWWNAREILQSLRVPDKEVQERLVRSQALEQRSELLQLYVLIAQSLSMHQQTDRSPRVPLPDAG